VTHDHFKLVVMTWEESLVTDVTVSWMAYQVNPMSPFASCIASQPVPCMSSMPGFNVGAGNGPRDFVQKITWPEFADVPAVATWLSGMEIYTAADVRLKAVEKSRTRSGCDLVFGTWNDTAIGGGDITYFAFLDNIPGSGAQPAGMRDATGRRFNFAPPTETPSAPSAPVGLPASDDNTGMECVVCFERPKDTLLQPCNHICCCSTCANKLSPNICPVCRTAITSKQKIYFT